MSTAPSILVYGHEATLLQTRAWVLGTAGYRVFCTKYKLESNSSEPIDLLVLCHTLSPEERRNALLTLASEWPEAKKLQLRPSSGLPENDVGIFDIFEGPRGLLQKVDELLQRA